MILNSGVENSLPQTVYRLKHDCHCKICDYGMVIMVNCIPDSNPLKLQCSNEGSNTEDQQHPLKLLDALAIFLKSRNSGMTRKIRLSRTKHDAKIDSH